MLGSLMAATFLLTSCLEDNTEEEATAYASIVSFSINNLKAQVTDTNASGEDTTYTVTVTGSLYPFSIDHVNGEIYNRDSLPVGTDITKATVDIGYEGLYIVYGEGDEMRYYSTTDSIDFTSPVRFTVYATDGVSNRTYYIRLNVHQTNSESLVWEQPAQNGFPGEGMTEQKAVTQGDRLYVLAQHNGTTALTSTLLTDGRVWTALTPVTGLADEADCHTLTALDDNFYLLAGGKLYNSNDCATWLPCNEESSFSDIIGTADGQLYLRAGDTVLAGTPDEGWTTIQQVDETVFPLSPSVISSALTTNHHITRTTLVGIPEGYTADTCAVVWTKLSTESVWTYYNNSQYGCPLLEDLTVVGWEGKLYAFGGKSLNRNKVIEPFEAIFTSTDGGITWQRQASHMGLPDELAGFEGSHSCVVDNKGFIWLMAASEGAVYRANLGALED